MMLRHQLWALVGLVLFALSSVRPLHAQISPATAAGLGMGNNYTALARGVSALSFNPAGLGMPGTPGFGLSLLPVTGQQTLQPIGFSDLVDFEGSLLTESVKEEWLGRISSAGGEAGGFGADVTPLAFHVGAFGVQFSTLVRGVAGLSPDAAELLLYGNSGRAGTPGDFDLQGSDLSGLAVSTVGLGFGHRVPVEGGVGGGILAVGGTLKYSVGHALVLARDLGSQVQGDPLQVSLDFPMIVSDTSDIDPNHGSGVGLDLGAAWEKGPWGVGLTVENLLHSFEWDLGGMHYIPGEALFNEDLSESDFDVRPAEQAPGALRDLVSDLRFEPRLSLGGAYRATEDLTVSGDLRKRFGDGIEVGPEFHAGLGIEYRALSFLPLRVGAAKITDGFQLGGGMTVILGPVRLGWAGALQRGDVEGTMASFSLSFQGG
jgi:hypothetical protein